MVKIKKDANILSNTQYALQQNINKALKDTNSNNSFNFEKVSNETANKIKELTGIDVANRNQVLLDSDIRHMLKEHGNQQREKSRGQIAITEKDILEIHNILKKYDKIEVGTDNKQGKTIRYKKNYSDNITTIVEVVPKKSSLKIKTMWKTTLDNSNKAPILTSKTQVDKSTLNTKNISQKDQKVNDISTNSNMLWLLKQNVSFF